MRQVFHLPYPISVNDMFANNNGRGRGRYPTKEYRAWKVHAEKAIRKTGVQLIDGLTVVDIEIGRKDGRRRDIDNQIKGILDMLTHMGVIEDDYLVARVTAEWVPKTQVDGARVTVAAYEKGR